MSKKIMFMSSAKLTAISFGLLLAVFCTIGMSFRPVYDEDEAAEIVMSSQKRAHWDNKSTDSCTGAVTHRYNSTVDKANTNVQTRGNGYVTISTSETANVTAPSSGNPRTVTSAAATSGSTATISWNSGLATETNASSPTYSSEQITVAHKKTFTISATPISDDYYFAGWGTTTSESSIDNYDNPREIVSDMKITGYTEGSKGNPDYSSTAYSETYYAFFKLRVPANITLKVPTNGTITYSYESYPATTLTSEKVVTTKYDLALVATPDAGYVFFGWYTMEGSTENFISTSENYTRAYPDDITIYAKFIPSNQAIFNVKGTEQYYYDLGRACSEAASSSSKIVYPIADGTVPAGNYTIPAGVTLLIPYNSANNTQTKPALVTAESALTIYRKLTLLDGANITVNGNICVGGQQTCMSGGKPSGYVTGACGVIDMSLGGHIELNNGSYFYAWGFVKGQDMDQGNNTVGVGTISANNGAKVYENFAVGDWRGGSACLDIRGTNFFPFQSYFIQNIEVPLTVNYGAVDNCYASVSGGGQNLQLPATMIGTTDALFKLASGGVVRKWYDATTDLMCFELSGTANLDAVVVKGLPVIGNISSSDYYLPISSNMHIILTNSNVTISKPMTVQPGAKIEVKSDANITISSNVFLYDKEEWGAYAGPSYYFHNYGNTYGILTTHKNRGNGKSKDLLDDAQIIVDGQLNITGKLYSTASGADVMGNGGGHAIFSALPSSSTTIAAFTGNGDAVSGGVTVNTANLHNEDESYTKAIASTTFYNVHGRWFKSGNQNENADHTYNFTYIASGAVSGTGGTDVSPNTHNAVYAPDKTGLTAGMKWCNVEQDGTCSNIYNATQALNETPASDIRYTYPSDSWLQLLRTETEGVYGGSDNSLYAVDGCAVNSLGSVDENCLYTIDGVKKALVDGHFVALEKNTEDEAFHNTANTEEYYISFAGCTWHPATKYAGEEKAYIVEGGMYIWYNNDWLLVEREDPYFFDYNDQNVKRYYEYENGEWVLADPKVRVTDAIETRDFFFLPEAFAIANGKKNATITILKDITDTTTPLSYTQTNTTCTLDLNGHTVNLTITGSGTTGVNMIKIDASGSTFTITDNSAEKDGKLILKQGITTATATKRWYGIVLANGSLALNAGEVQAINDFTYTSTKNTGMISAIYIAAGKTFTMNGGSIYAESPYYPRAIEIAGSASANATVTLNAGTITANATTVTNAMGIYTVGGTTTIKEGVTINATTKTTSAYGVYVDASTSGYWGTVNMTGGTVNATATTTTALGAFVNGTYTFNNTTPNTIKGTYRAVLSISGGSFNVETLGTTTAYGIQTRGTTTITGGTFNVTPKTTTAYGLLVQDGTTTISGTPTFTVRGTTTAYGIYANGATPEDKTGRPYNPNVIVNGGMFDVTTTTGDVAYGVYAGAGTRVITSTASDYYPGIYSSIGTVTVNGGTFNVTAKTYNAIGVYVHRVAAYESGTNTAHVFRGVANIAGGTFTVRDLTHKTTTGACDGVRSYGTLNITGGSFDVAASAATAKNATYVYGVNVYDGTATVSGTPEFTVSAYGTAFGAVANGATPDKATGLPCEADLTIDGGTFNVNTTTGATAYGVYAAGPAPRVITSTAAGYYPGTYYSKPVATVNDGTFNVKAKTTTAIGAYCGRGVLYDQEVLEPHTVELESFGELNIKGGTFNVSTLGTTTADGVRSFGTTNITGGTFNVTPKTTTATAIRTYAGKTTITDNPHFTVKGTTTVYGLNAGCEAPNTKSGLTYNGEIECNGGTFDLETTTGATCYGVYAYAGSVKITTLHSANADYFAGNYASAGTIVVNDGIFNVKAKTTGAYGVVVPAAVSQSGATGYPTATATAKCDVNGGKFLVNGTEKYAVNKKATTANFKISGGYWGGDGVNNNLAYYAVSPNKVLTLREAHALYPDGYRYTIGEGGTVIWKNGETTLLSEDYLKGETPEYTGTPPTKTDAEYEYTHNGWDPTIADMDNSDATYSATFSQTEKKYSVSVAAGANGSVSPASVSGIGCVTASGDITAVSNTGYHFVNWTIPEGVTTADGYTASSNPIRIHATASGKTITANFEANTYTVTLDNQSATTAGESSVTTTYGAAMPSIAANLPEKTGYTFDGYYSATNGGGTQYYNADGTSAHVWDIDGETTLYAKWTPAVASVTAGSTTTYYATIEAAFAAANSSVTYDPTITLLRDATTTTQSMISYTGSKNCTLNLNGHTLSSTTAQALLYINKTGITFTITDLTVSKSGSLHLESASTDNRWCVYVADGNLQMDAGTISLHSKANQFNEAVRIDPAASTFTMNGGKVHVVTSDSKPACGIVSKGIAVINGGEIQVEASGAGYGIEARVKDTNIGNITVNGGKFLVTGTTAACAYKSAANATLKLQGGYYNTNTNLADNCLTPYHVLPLTSEDPYQYEVAEAYTITFKDGDGNPLTNTATTNNLWKKNATPSYTGTTPTKTEDENYTYTFNNSWLPAIEPATADATYTAQFSRTEKAHTYYFIDPTTGTETSMSSATAPADPADYDDEDYTYGFTSWTDNGNGTYTASYSVKAERIYGARLDIVDWTADAIVVNATNLRATNGGTAWTIKYASANYTKANLAADRTVLIARDKAHETANGYVVIKLQGTAGVESRQKYTVPLIYDANATLSETESNSVVYVHMGATLTVNANTTISKLYVSPAANVEITSGTLTVTDTLALRTLPWQSAAINGNFTAGHTYYTRIGPDKNKTIAGLNGTTTYVPTRYYQLALPLNCSIADVRLSDGTTPVYESTWALKNYSESLRASKGSEANNWVFVPESGTIQAWTGYEFISNYKYYREYYFPVTPPTSATAVTVARTGDDKANSGWNMICSPLMSRHQKNPHPEDITVSWLNEEDGYTQEIPDIIHPAIPFFYQAKANNEQLSFAGTDVEPSLAPRRVAAADEQVRIQWMHLDIKDASGQGDQTSVYSHPTRYDAVYKTGIDVAKQSFTASRALIYSSHAYGEMAFAGVADVLLENGVALTVYSPKEQELTISMRDNEWLNRMAYVWLIDNATGAQIDLLDSDYTFEATAGTTTGRFILMGRFFAPQIATDIDEVDGEQVKPKKLIIRDKLYILINDQLYDGTGKMVK